MSLHAYLPEDWTPEQCAKYAEQHSLDSFNVGIPPRMAGQVLPVQLPLVVDQTPPIPNPCRIYDLVAELVDDGQPPLAYDFGLAPLHKSVEETWQGDDLLIVYYVNPDNTVPVVQRSYTIAYPVGNPPRVEVVETISWYRRDGSLHPVTKALPRVYTGQRWLDWLEGKRKQIINWLRWNVASAMIYNLMSTGPFEGSLGSISDLGGVMVEGGAFFGEYSSQISAYVGGYARAFPEAVAADGRAWLDLPWPGGAGSIRDKFAEQLIYS